MQKIFVALNSCSRGAVSKSASSSSSDTESSSLPSSGKSTLSLTDSGYQRRADVLTNVLRPETATQCHTYVSVGSQEIGLINSCVHGTTFQFRA